MYRNWKFEANAYQGAHFARRDFAGFLESFGVFGSEQAASELIFGELVANALKYGAEPIRAVVCSLSDGRVQLVVEDSGRCFELPVRRAAGRCRICATLPFVVPSAGSQAATEGTEVSLPPPTRRRSVVS